VARYVTGGLRKRSLIRVKVDAGNRSATGSTWEELARAANATGRKRKPRETYVPVSRLFTPKIRMKLFAVFS